MPRSKKRHRRSRRSLGETYRSNPAPLAELAPWVGGGFAGFMISRAFARVAADQVGKRKPSWGRHIGAVAAVASFAASWFLVQRVKVLEKYHMPIALGSALAALQSVLQIYVPKIGWVLGDPTPDALPAAPESAVSQLAAQGMQVVDEDPNEFVYNDSFDAGRYTPAPAQTKIGPVTAKARSAQDDDDLADLVGEDLNLGSLAPN